MFSYFDLWLYGQIPMYLLPRFLETLNAGRKQRCNSHFKFPHVFVFFIYLYLSLNFEKISQPWVDALCSAKI